MKIEQKEPVTKKKKKIKINTSLRPKINSN